MPYIEILVNWMSVGIDLVPDNLDEPKTPTHPQAMPVLQASRSGRGANRLCHQVSKVAGTIGCQDHVDCPRQLLGKNKHGDQPSAGNQHPLGT